MNLSLLAIVIFSFLFQSCQNDPFQDALHDVRAHGVLTQKLPLKNYEETIREPIIHYEWKRKLVQLTLEKHFKKIELKVKKEESDIFMEQAAKEMIKTNGIIISGVVFHLEQNKTKETNTANKHGESTLLFKKLESIADIFYKTLLLDPSDQGLRKAKESAAATLPKGAQLNLRLNTKVLAPQELPATGWLYFPHLFTAHKNSPIDNVVPPIKTGTSIFVTVLRKRIEHPEIEFSVIKKRAIELALAVKKNGELTQLFGKAATKLDFQLHPEVIQKKGGIE